MPLAKLREIDMFYEEAGAGEPLLVTTGWALAERAFARHHGQFCERYRVIRHDHRHIGRSSAPEGPTDFATMGDDLAQLLDHLDIASARVLGGGGMGALVAMQLAIRHPERVSALHLGSPCLKADPFLVSILTMWKRLRALDPVLWAEEVTHWCYTPASFDRQPDLVGDAAKARAGEQTFPQQSSFERIADAYIAHDVRQTAGSIRCPVQISNGGEQDLITGPRMARPVAEAIPGAELVVFEDCSHNYFNEDPERFGRIVLDFFAAN